jgi:protein translocase SEC61 complex gamma subunit
MIEKTKLWIFSQKDQYMRVWRLLKKPSMEEFKLTAKISAAGLLIIGAMGFLISIAVNLVI